MGATGGACLGAIGVGNAEGAVKGSGSGIDGALGDDPHIIKVLLLGIQRLIVVQRDT